MIAKVEGWVAIGRERERNEKKWAMIIDFE
jgi:hypothetical protein